MDSRLAEIKNGNPWFARKIDPKGRVPSDIENGRIVRYWERFDETAHSLQTEVRRERQQHPFYFQTHVEFSLVDEYLASGFIGSLILGHLVLAAERLIILHGLSHHFAGSFRPTQDYDNNASAPTLTGTDANTILAH